MKMSHHPAVPQKAKMMTRIKEEIEHVIPANEVEEYVEYSDEDFMAEGANDYVDTYFDAGDDFNYGDKPEEEGVY
jgi:predicted transcriptional regulator